MPPRTKALLFDMQHAALGIAAFIEGKTLKEYLADEMLRSAVERQFEIIGEAMTRLRKFDPAAFAMISESDRIIGLRNQLIHGYDVINHETTLADHRGQTARSEAGTRCAAAFAARALT